MTCEADSQVALLLAAETPVVTIVGKSWDLHVHHVLETTLEENLRDDPRQRRLPEGGRAEVIYDAEHFFDGYKATRHYALACVAAAQEAGADAWCCATPTAATCPGRSRKSSASTAEHSQRVARQRRHRHSHARRCRHGVANALAAVRAGATQVQGTINGIGERVGNCNLCTIIPNLQLKMGLRCLEDEQLARLTELSRFVSEVANLAPNARQPYVGASAFAHKGGIHVAAVMKVEHSYQHIDPTLVGNERRVLVSELSGRGNLVYKAQEFGVDASKEEVQQVLAQIKELENRGFYFEGAEASVALMLHRLKPGYRRPFELIDFMVVVEHRQGRGIFAEASVKVQVGDEIMHTAAEGNGPVNALDKALRKALIPHYPQLAEV